jgi:3-O-methylgallate 3,4-dioxygenase
MARIVLGLGTSHSPQVSTQPEQWHLHAERDYSNPQLDMPALEKRAPAGIAGQLSVDVYRAKHETCQREIEHLSATLVAARPDVVVVVGDDQRELFLDECSPAFALYTGGTLLDIPPDPATVLPSHQVALWSRHASTQETYPARADFALHAAAAMSSDDFDIATAGAQFAGRSIGHAYTFVRLRLLRETIVPIVPVFINCYYPPNQPSPSRCYAFGQALRRAIESWPGELRVAIVASGGLSHFVIDEALDRQLLAGIAEKRSDLITSLPAAKLNSGSSEIRNWIAVAAAMEDVPVASLSYVPCYRTPSGTGCGMAFVQWKT